MSIGAPWKGNILNIMDDRQWFDAGLETLPPARAQRVRLFRGLIATATMLRVRMDRLLADSGLTTQQATLLNFVIARPTRPALSEVARGLGMTHQNVKQIALALERKGFVEFAADPADGRIRRLVPTERCRRFWRRRDASDFDRVETWTAGLTDDEVDTVVRLLARLRARMDEGAG